MSVVTLHCMYINFLGLFRVLTMTTNIKNKEMTEASVSVCLLLATALT